jgi:tRNA pseudouridine38-40 synthase
MTVAYDGGAFHGLAPQPGQRTVVGEIIGVLMKVCRLADAPHVRMSGRTDAGVHGWGQVLAVDVPDGTDTGRLIRSLQRMLEPEIVVRELTVVDPTFDARHDAIWRRYRYTVLNDPVADPFLAGTTWHVPQPLEIDLLRLACDPLLGEHDFSSFCMVVEREGQTNRRRVMSAQWTRPTHDPRLLIFEITGNAFCRQMVRSIVGLLVDVGRGRRKAGEVLTVLHARDRHLAAPVAPAHGLCLWEVGYGGSGSGGSG